MNEITNVDYVPHDHEGEVGIDLRTVEGLRESIDELERQLLNESEELNYRTEGTQTYVYRGNSNFPLVRFEYLNRASGWKLWWVDPDEILSIDELKQLAQIGENLADEIPTVTFVDITKEK